MNKLDCLLREFVVEMSSTYYEYAQLKTEYVRDDNRRTIKTCFEIDYDFIINIYCFMEGSRLVGYEIVPEINQEYFTDYICQEFSR